MNPDRFAGICRQFKGRLKERWGRLSSNPLSTDAGTRDRLAGEVQEQRGIRKEATERELRNFLDRHRNWWDRSQKK